MPIRLLLRRTSTILMVWLCLLGSMALTMTLTMRNAQAHMLSAYNLRVVHFEHRDNGMMVYYRLSLPLVLGHALEQMKEAPYPYFIINEMTNQTLFHYLNPIYASQHLDQLANYIDEGHDLSVAGERIEPEFRSIVLHPRGHVPPFNTLEEVQQAVQPQPLPEDMAQIESGYVLVDAAFFYPTPRAIHQFQFASRLNQGYIGEQLTRNLLVDHDADKTITLTQDGLLDQSITINPSLSEAVLQFMQAGLQHIWTGWDHMLFVLCLIAGPIRLRQIALRVTGFSIGHTLSLIAGFYGLAPTGSWFAPMIEVSIAASIFLTALLIITRRLNNMMTLPMTVTIGVLHGFGFAFGLREMLHALSPNILPSLLSFNLGVEVGQLAVALLAWGTFMLLRHNLRARISLVYASVGVISLLISGYWISERLPLLMTALA
ncbi:HupE/UreJ family protein [Ampullimonas aquatilis]|uniref:HupE/UreJ family protein n=1 Tax=Ampullimonas aquatilis TaxID=1341549 RepID=UPI003C707EAF